MKYFPLNATVILDGVNVTPYVMSINRKMSVCSVTQIATIEIDKTLLGSYLWGSAPIIPSMGLTVDEFGERTFYGTVRKATFERNPDYRILVEGMDMYKFVQDYFIDDDFRQTNGESVAYWAEYLINLSGLSASIDSSELNDITVAPGVDLKLRTAEDALTEVLSYASAYVYADGSGVIHVRKGARSSGIIFSGGDGYFSGGFNPQNLKGGNITKASHILHDENTRDVVKVWGYTNPRVILRPGQSGLISAEASVDLGLPVHKTMIYSSSMIQTAAEADRLAGTIITALGRFDSIKTLDVAGNPKIVPTKDVQADIRLETEHLKGTYMITDVNSDLSKDGYMMTVTLDQFCPKFAGWEEGFPISTFYAGTTTDGVYISTDTGQNWGAINTGLPAGTKSVKRVAANSDKDAMAIVNSNLYYYNGTTWQLCHLPSPQSEFGGYYGSYGRFVAVSAGGIDGNYYALTTSGTTTLMSGAVFGNTGTSGHSGGAVDFSIAGTPVVTQAQINDGFTITYGTTTFDASGGLSNLILNSTMPGPYIGGTVYMGYADVAIHVTTFGNSYSNGYPATRCIINGTLSVSGDANQAGIINMFLSSTPDYYGTGVVVSPSNMSSSTQSGATVGVTPGNSVDFSIHSPFNNQYNNNWFTDGYVGIRITAYTDEGYSVQVNVSISSIQVEYDDGGSSGIVTLPTTISGVMENRAFLYTSLNGGLHTTDWTSSAIHDADDYNFYGVDLNATGGLPYILAAKSAINPPATVSTILMGDLSRTRYVRERVIEAPAMPSPIRPINGQKLTGSDFQVSTTEFASYGVKDVKIQNFSQGSYPVPGSYGATFRLYFDKGAMASDLYRDVRVGMFYSYNHPYGLPSPNPLIEGPVLYKVYANHIHQGYIDVPFYLSRTFMDTWGVTSIDFNFMYQMKFTGPFNNQITSEEWVINGEQLFFDRLEAECVWNPDTLTYDCAYPENPAGDFGNTWFNTPFTTIACHIGLI